MPKQVAELLIYYTTMHHLKCIVTAQHTSRQAERSNIWCRSGGKKQYFDGLMCPQTTSHSAEDIQCLGWVFVLVYFHKYAESLWWLDTGYPVWMRQA